MTMTLGIVGFGKIATDAHVPAIETSSRFVLHSTADPAGGSSAVPHFSDIEAMLAADDTPDAVAICTPPRFRYRAARAALEAGRHVLLEKPPCVTLGEVETLRALADRAGRSLFCAWHSRFAPALAPAREWLSGRIVRRMRIDWQEDVDEWHPGQTWIWQPGGFGVFDPGINALSIATELVAGPLLLRDALLRVARNAATPSSVELSLVASGTAEIEASFDFLHAGPPIWTIEVETDSGRLQLTEGGGRLEIDDEIVPLPRHDEYAGVYDRFAQIIDAGTCDADTTPLRLVADALLCGRTIAAPALELRTMQGALDGQ